MEAFLISTGLVAIAEIGDETNILAMILATRYRQPVPVILASSWRPWPTTRWRPASARPGLGRRRCAGYWRCPVPRDGGLVPDPRQGRRWAQVRRQAGRLPGDRRRPLPGRDGRQDPARDHGTDRALSLGCAG